MATTLSDLRDEIRRRFEQSSTTRLSDERLDAALNAGLEELGERSEFVETYVVVPILGGRTYYDLRGILPDEAIRVTAIWSPKSHWWLKGAHIREFPFRQWEKAAGMPRRFWMKGLFHLGIFPRPDGTVSDPSAPEGIHLHVYFTAVPTALAHSDQRIFTLPDDLSDAVEEYAMYELYVQEGETPKALLHWNHFLEMVELTKTQREKRQTRARRWQRFGGKY